MLLIKIIWLDFMSHQMSHIVQFTLDLIQFVFMPLKHIKYSGSLNRYNNMYMILEIKSNYKRQKTVQEVAQIHLGLYQ